jgi:RNA polymerase sigma-70 factor (ECF subfamily)
VKGDDWMANKTDLRDEQIYVIKRNSDMVYRIAYSQMKNKDDADDVYQDVFYRYIKKQPIFENQDHEKAWFIRVALNCSKTSLTSFWNTKTCELDENIQFPQVDKEDLSFALNKLSKKHRAVLYLFYYEDMSTKQIAQALNINEGNVRMLLTRARRELKKILEKEQQL